MTERQVINEVVQLVPEVTPGTAVTLATKRMSALSLDFTPSLETKQYKAMGYRWNTVNVLNKEWTDFKLNDSPLTYDELPYALAMLFGQPTITTPATGTNTRQHVWSPSTTAPLNPQTFTVEQGSPVHAARVAGAQLTGITFDFSRDECKVSGEGMGQQFTDDIQLSTNATYTLTANATPPTSGNYTLTYGGQTTASIAWNAIPSVVQAALEALSNIAVGDVVVSLTTAGPNTATANTVYTIEFRGLLAGAAQTLTGTFSGLTASGSIAIAAGVTGATPSTLPLVPIEAADVSVYADPAAASLGSTKLLRVTSLNINLSSLFGPYWVLDSSKASYVATPEIDPTGEVKMVLQADAVGMGYLTKARAGTRTFIRVEAIGNIIEAALTYRARFDLSCEVTDIAFGDDQGIRTAEITLTLMHDSTYAKALSIELRNTLTAVA